MIKQNIFKLIASSVIILFPVIFSGISKTFLVMPLILLLIQWTCILITLKDNESNGQNKKIFSLVIFILPFISLFSTTLFFCAVKGKNMYLIVGLGNPDKKYEKTFHNMGYIAVGDAAELLGAKFKKKGMRGECCRNARQRRKGNSCPSLDVYEQFGQSRKTAHGKI